MPDNTNELLADETRKHAIRVEKYTRAVQQRIMQRLKKMQTDIQDKMASVDWENMKDLRKQSFQNKLKVVKTTIDEYYKTIKDETVDKLIDLNDLEATFIDNLSSTIPIEMNLDTLTPTELKNIATKNFFHGTPLEEFWDRQSVALRNKVSDEIRSGIMLGENNDEIRKRIAGDPKRGVPSVMQISERDARTVVRTSVQTVANSTRIETYRNNRELIKGVQWVSTFDGRTSQMCLARNGLVWLFDGDGNLQPDGHSIPFSEPPIHPNCRSTLVPISKSWRELGFDVDELEPSTKASMDGQIPEETTMDDWLRSKPDDFIFNMLGPTKGSLFKAGKIDLKDLLDEWGNLKTAKSFKG